jgi:hypothetical protein
MTEDEAKTKWCPHARHGQPDTHTYRGANIIAVNTDAKCIASQCMAWRWIACPVAGVPLQTVVAKRGDFYHPEIVPAVLEVIGDGYCGLVGPAT